MRETVLAAQADLFDAPRLAGLSQADAIVTRPEEQTLIASIDAVELSPFRFHGWLGKRLTASFGWRYDFDNAGFEPAEPIPDWLLPLREKAARFAGLVADELVQALLIRYDWAPELVGIATARCSSTSWAEAPRQWEHSIAGMPAMRWSITFRSLSEEGRRL